MSYNILVSNAAGRNYNLPLSLKDSRDNMYIKDFFIPAYALNYNLEFSNEEEYNKWAKIHEDYVSGKEAVIKTSKASGHALERQNEKIVKEEADKIKSDQKKINDLDSDLELKTEVGKLNQSKGKK